MVSINLDSDDSDFENEKILQELYNMDVKYDYPLDGSDTVDKEQVIGLGQMKLVSQIKQKTLIEEALQSIELDVQIKLESVNMQIKFHEILKRLA